jgi:hypothetical protein
MAHLIRNLPSTPSTWRRTQTQFLKQCGTITPEQWAIPDISLMIVTRIVPSNPARGITICRSASPLCVCVKCLRLDRPSSKVHYWMSKQTQMLQNLPQHIKRNETQQRSNFLYQCLLRRFTHYPEYVSTTPWSSVGGTKFHHTIYNYMDY